MVLVDKRFSGEYVVALMFFSVYMSVSILFGGLGFERDTYSHVTLIQEIVGYRVYLPYFGREYMWLPSFHYLGAFLYLFFAKSLAPVYVARFIISLSSALTLFVVYRWLKDLNVEFSWRVVTVLLIGLNGYWLSYSCQSMTDVFSVSLLTGWLYFLELYLKHSQMKHLFLASTLALMNVMTRYEAWLFMAISTVFLLVRSKRVLAIPRNLKRNLVSCTIFALPSIAFISFWLAYNFLGKQDPLYFIHILTEFSWSGFNVPYYHDLGKVMLILFGNLLFASGLLWLFPFLEAYKGSYRALFSRFSVLMSTYLLLLIPQLYIGANTGHVRHWLFLFPLSSIGFAAHASHTKNKWLTLFCVMITILFSIVGLQQNISMHLEYLKTFGADEQNL